MTQAPALKLTAQRAQPWAALKFIPQLVKSGMKPKVVGAALDVLVMYLAHANQDGEAYPSTDTLAKLNDCSESTIKRGRKKLIELGLLELVKAPARGRNTATYRLVMPEELTENQVADLTPRLDPSVKSEPPGVHSCTLGGCKSEPPRGCTDDPYNYKQELSSSNAPPGNPGSPGSPGSDENLWQPPRAPEPPGFDAAAAALLEGMGFDKPVARGLVSQYRPTAEQVQNVLDNIAEKDDYARRTGKGREVHNPEGFMRWALREGELQPDPAVARKRKAAEKSKEMAEQAAQDKARQKAQEQAKQQAEAKARQQWEAMPLEDRQAVYEQMLATMPDMTQQQCLKQGIGNPFVVGLCLTHLQKQSRK